MARKRGRIYLLLGPLAANMYCNPQFISERMFSTGETKPNYFRADDMYSSKTITRLNAGTLWRKGSFGYTEATRSMQLFVILPWK